MNFSIFSKNNRGKSKNRTETGYSKPIETMKPEQENIGFYPIINQIKSKKILINVHSDLNNTRFDTIMVSNYMNLLMRNNNHITLITKYKCPNFIKNLSYNNYTIVISGDDTKNIMNDIDKYMCSIDYAFIRNRELLYEMRSKSYLNKVIFYGLETHIDGIKKMKFRFHSIITKSEVLKQKYIDEGINEEKIQIKEPIATMKSEQENINFHRGDFTEFNKITSKKILINVHSNLNNTAGDTIMVSNYMNLLMKNNNHITLITKYKCRNFIKNLTYNKFSLVISGDNKENIMNTIDKYMSSVDYAFIRNHEILDEMRSKSYLNRVIFYGLDCLMNGLKKMNNKFHSIITQSELLKKKLVKNNIDSEKIYIVQPIAYKYDFDLPERNDNEVRLIYCGTLRDEENILEIIEEFQKIHKKRPEVVLKIVYGKIHGDVTFTRKVNEYIKNGVKGITFKHNLSHKDACYEIATSDIGICWRKNGWGDNGEVSTKVKEYELYKLKILTNNFNINIKSKNHILIFKNANDFNNILKNYDKDVLIKGNYKILYMANTSLPRISGYTIRTKYILKEINKHYPIICFVKPTHPQLQQTRIYSIDNIIYYNYNDRKNYQKFLEYYIGKNISNINFIWASSDNYNGIICGDIAKKLKIKSAYEIRGFWHYSRKYRESCENYFDEKFFNNYDKKEKIACQMNDFILCENNNILNICNKQYSINKSKLFLLSNGVDNKSKLFLLSNGVDNFKESNIKLKRSKITFGYIGSIVSYEGLENLVNQIKKIGNKYNIELIIVGGGKTNDAIKTIDKIIDLIKNIKNIKYVGSIPHEEVNKYYDMIDIICLPRIDCEVCNIVAPLKPFEAMMNGKIVLASSVDALSEIITHNYNGILFDKKNINDLYIKINEILDGKYNLEKIIKNSYDYCSKHTWSKNIASVLSILENII